MSLVRLETVDSQYALSESFGVLASCGYESRSSAIVARLVEDNECRMALAFREHASDARRLENEARFLAAGFEIAYESGGSGEVSRAVISAVIDAALAKGKAITIDISTMTRLWYAAALSELRSRSFDVPFVVNFCYFPGVYKEDFVKGTPNEVVGPVPGFCSLDAPEKPTALVLGLGFDEERARGLQELLEPKRTVFLKVGEIFRALPEVSESLRAPTLGNAWRDAIEYPLQDPLTTFQLTESISRALSAEHRVILISLGPKILGLLFLLIGILRPEVSVWRVSSGSSQPPTDTEAQPEAVVCRTIWK